jgi:hypothetical protein
MYGFNTLLISPTAGSWMLLPLPLAFTSLLLLVANVKGPVVNERHRRVTLLLPDQKLLQNRLLVLYHEPELLLFNCAGTVLGLAQSITGASMSRTQLMGLTNTCFDRAAWWYICSTLLR